MQSSLQEFLDFAKQIAVQGGTIALDYYGKAIQINHKNVVNNLVTEADLAVEDYLIKQIQTTYPDHNLITEESGNIDSTSDYTWFIDPIDGTTNFAHGYPFFAVSLGLYHQKKGLLGVIFAPKLNELFIGTPDQSFLNDTPLKVSSNSLLEQSLLGTGFPPDRNTSDYTKSIQLFTKTQTHIHGVRRSGSACLDLAYTAAGRLDGFFEIGLQPWDTAAGAIIVQGAGGTVTDFDNQPFSPFSHTIIASNSHIHPELANFLAKS